jgi:bromodomain-containing protein 4
MSCNLQQIRLSIEGMLNNSMPVDKKITPPDSTKISTVNCASAFKNKNMKNVSSWSSLAQASSPQNTSGSINSSVKPTMDNSFQAFKKQTKGKMVRQRALIEQLGICRVKKEQQCDSVE